MLHCIRQTQKLSSKLFYLTEINDPFVPVNHIRILSAFLTVIVAHWDFFQCRTKMNWFIFFRRVGSTIVIFSAGKGYNMKQST